MTAVHVAVLSPPAPLDLDGPEATGWEYCKMPLSLHVSDAFLVIEPGYGFGGGGPQRCRAVSLPGVTPLI